MSGPVPIAVLASGRGSNFGALMEAIRRRELDAEVVALISDQPGAGALEKARGYGVRASVVPPPRMPVSAAAGGAPGADRADESARAARLHERRAAHERALLDELGPLGARFLVLAGYMRILTPHLIDSFRGDRGYSRMVNIHPSLLPAFPGVGGYAQAWRYGAKLAGVSVHLVEPEVDGGPICAQEAFDIADCESEREVEERGLAIEHRLYPRVLSWVLPENFRLENRGENRRACVRPN